MNPQVIGDLETAAAQEFTPQLAGMGMEKTVTVYNPMPVDFRVKYTRSIAANAPLTPEMKFTQEKTGLDLSRRGPVSGHVSHTIVLKSKSVVNLPGDIAQIAVQKLISVIIQTRNDDGSYDFDGHGGHKGMVPDPHLRETIEAEVVREIKDTMSMMNTETPTDFTDRQISELNEEREDDNPPPGTGKSYTPAQTVSAGAGQPDSAQSETTPDSGNAAKPKRGRPTPTSVEA